MQDEYDEDDASLISVQLDEDTTKYLSIDDLFRTFDRHVLVDSKVSMKNYVKQHKDPYSDIVDGEEMSELSGCTLIDIPFEMTLSQYWLWMIRDVHEGRYDRV